MPSRTAPPVAPSAETYARPAPIKIDPLATFIQADYIVTLGGYDFEIAAPMADFWLSALLDDPIEWDAILPGLLDEDNQTWVESQLVTGAISQEELMGAILDLIGAVCGCKWWVALRLLATARASWDHLGGQAVLHGMYRVGEYTLGAWLSALLALMWERVPPKEMARFSSELTTPPPGYAEEFDPEEEEEAFFAAMSMM